MTVYSHLVLCQTNNPAARHSSGFASITVICAPTQSSRQSLKNVENCCLVLSRMLKTVLWFSQECWKLSFGGLSSTLSEYSKCSRVHCVCPGPWPLNLFFPDILSLFWLGGSFMALIIWNVKTCALGLPHPFPPQCPCRSRLPFSVHVTWAPTHLIQGRACE